MEIATSSKKRVAASEILMEPRIVSSEAFDRAAAHLGRRGVVLPTFAELAEPNIISAEIGRKLPKTKADEPDPLNLFRIHWFNAEDWSGLRQVPAHIELPASLTGVDARIVVVLGDSFPMIGAHKVLAAYACLLTRLVTGQFDPHRNRAVWPSTGNYCRGGIAISRILGCRGVAVLPEGMSRERFDWLEKWTTDPNNDIIRTPGSESNVREIYEACDELERDPTTVILNQFSEFANYLVHRRVTGPSLETLFASLTTSGKTRLAAYVAGTGSGGTLGAGDHLKKTRDTRIAAVEPLECPTMLENGYGAHNIQGIGDKHIPLIQNVMNMDFVIGVSECASDLMNVLFNASEGKAFLAARTGIDQGIVSAFEHIGLSGLAAIQGSIKLAKHMQLTSDDVVICMATDGAAMYVTEARRAVNAHFKGRSGTAECAEIFGRTLAGCEPAHVLELTATDRRRIFNLGYYTWVEQRGVSIEAFDSRRSQSYWDDIAETAPAWDGLVRQFNDRASRGLFL
jgi:cysteine synthase